MAKTDKPDAWMPLYIGDWDGDTGHLDCEQDGAYGRMVRWYWRMGPLPDDDGALARIIRMDLRAWRKIRPVIAAFFVIEGGVWRHKRVDEEKEKWSKRKAGYIARSSAGGKAKAAKSSASSTPKALPKSCPSSSSTEVDAPIGQSTLCGRDAVDERAEGSSPPRSWTGPAEVWKAFVDELGAEATLNSVGRCAWQDLPAPTLIAPTGWIQNRIRREARPVLIRLGISVERRAA